MVELTSVASVVDDQTLMVYVKYQDGSYDGTSGVHITDLSETFFTCLDQWDKLVLNELFYQQKEKNKKQY
jgi:hypothetical protein